MLLLTLFQRGSSKHKSKGDRSAFSFFELFYTNDQPLAILSINFTTNSSYRSPLPPRGGLDTISVSDTRKHIWQIIYHFIAFFELNLGVILSFALIKPVACISQINFFLTRSCALLIRSYLYFKV